jgi:serine/threonine-protein kinase RsbW
VRAGRPAVLPAAQPVPAGEHRATVVLPLRARGRVLGALLLAGDGRRIGGRAGPDPVDDDFLMDLADRTGLALENARLYEEDREVARVLQRSMLAGAPPPDPRFQVVAAYQPGVATLEVGGDWHDAFAVAGDRVNLVVGDVVGRGLRAASAMGQLRSAVRALAGAGFGPAALLGHLDDYVATLEAGQMATVVLADLAVGSGELRYACAGHLPPLLLAPGEEPRYLWGGRSGPVGSFAAGGPRREHRIALARGSRLLLFTDGLIERRGEPLDRGMDRLLAEVAGRRGAPLPAMVDGVREAMAGGSGDDDLCLLAFAYEEAPTFRRELAADARLLSALRAALDGWLGQNGVPEPDRYGAVLACSEAVANAIEHGYRYDPAAVVSVTASISHGTLEIRVHDAGSWRRPGGSTDRGRGMTLMARTMDDLVVDRGEGTTVTLRRRLGRAAG